MKQKTNSALSFIKTSGIFFVGSILSKVITFFLLPIYTKYISPDDYGFYDLSITYITVITSLLFFDIWVSVMRYMYDKDNIKYKSSVIKSGFTIFGFSTCLYFILSIILIFALDVKYIELILLFGITTNVQTLYSFIARGFHKNIEFAISGIINTLVTAIFNILLIVTFHFNYSSLYIAAILGNIFQIFYLEFKLKILRGLFKSKFDKALTIHMFRYTLPLCINSVSYWLLTSYNRIVISRNLSLADNGLYAIGNKFIMVITLLTTCFTYAWQDLAFSKAESDTDPGKFYSKACNMYLKFLGLGTAVILPVYNIIFPIIVDEQYSKAKGIIPLFLLMSVFNAYVTFTGGIFHAIKSTMTIFYSMIVSCLLNVLMANYFVEIMGLNGASLSTLLSLLLCIVIRVVYLKKNMRFRVDFKLIVYIFSLILISSFIYIKFNNLINGIYCVACIFLFLYSFRIYIKNLVYILLFKIKYKDV